MYGGLLKTGINHFFAMPMTDMKAVTSLQQDRCQEKFSNDENRKRKGDTAKVAENLTLKTNVH